MTAVKNIIVSQSSRAIEKKRVLTKVSFGATLEAICAIFV